ncbi:3-hydroxyacyl-CoA dehydrogenase [Alteromonas lipolytica]|uniref:3-hydroxyacyl-CoA dehydrogenase n=1 Tax=Alteromonas lipolytica TaxID=1856405 RepID=A0A1E8FID7_9ALTE|nr:3-hydroxyacyl-CoA dehydrogenase [Alteromonas lipolytica]OFI35654.1 3-hydroxyacyl-CoA dehydrogenase [Alteromonas lipolytica]GGF77941.1 3-hydroxybutyryl-CoA dehydrogenase [Alteromonas lipolytica]
MSALETNTTVAVIGAGTMGAGIAQLAAAAGHPVVLFDAFDGAAEKGKAGIDKGLEKLVARGKMTADTKAALLARIRLATDIHDVAEATLVVEAIVENLDIKRELFANLESMVASDAILATNTSSISVTSIARDLKHPERFVGMHFFNPAPVMKLVEVISGVATDKDVAECVFATAENWGKIAVHAKSTPGFIVNRVARPYYAEALRLCEEQVADPATLDALLTGAGGFRLGPFALMDLIGHDVNYAVSESVFKAYYQEPRFRPSIMQLELVNAGRLGRKSGQGFYSYTDGAEAAAPVFEPVDSSAADIDVKLTGGFTIGGVAVERTTGATATARAKALGQPVILLDLTKQEGASVVAFSCSKALPESVVASLVKGLAAREVKAVKLPDWPGLVVMRTVAMLANEAFEAQMQGVGSAEAIDNAMKYGVNYPQGPIEWANEIGLSTVLDVLDGVYSLTRDPRYRAALSLRLAVDSE